MTAQSFKGGPGDNQTKRIPEEMLMPHIAASLIHLDKETEVSFCKAWICQKQL